MKKFISKLISKLVMIGIVINLYINPGNNIIAANLFCQSITHESKKLLNNRNKVQLAHIDMFNDTNKQESKNNELSLIEALRNNNTELAINLIEKRININEPDKDGWTPLTIAILAGNLELVKKLINYGAKTDKVFANTANIEIRQAHPDKLIDNLSLGGYTPIMLAMYMLADRELVKCLLLNSDKKTLDLQANDGNTALIFASMIYDKDIIAQLLILCSNKEAVNNAGYSAKTIANMRRQEDIILLLQ